MELHYSSAAAAKKVWSFLRTALLMLRKGLISKRKLALDLNLMMAKKQRGKVLRRTLANLNVMFHSKPTLPSPSPHNCIYEFSSTSTPVDPVYSSRMLRGAVAMNVMRCSPQCALGEMPNTPLPSPFSVRISNFSTEEESDGSRSCEVDKQAEDFIKRFHEQLRSQGPIDPLMEDYQEEEEEES